MRPLCKQEKGYRLRRYGRLAAGIGLILVFSAWLAPGLIKVLQSPMHTFIIENQIKTNAWFYTDSDTFDQGTAALGDELRFHPRPAPKPGN